MSSPPPPDATLVLRDGSTVTVRPIQAQDERSIADFYGKLSPESQAFRFFAAPTDVAEIARRLAISNLESQFGLAALSGNELVGRAVTSSLEPAARRSASPSRMPTRDEASAFCSSAGLPRQVSTPGGAIRSTM